MILDTSNEKFFLITGSEILLVNESFDSRVSSREGNYEVYTLIIFRSNQESSFGFTTISFGNEYVKV